MFKKYLVVFTKSFIRNLEFRTEMVLYFLQALLPFLVLFFVWARLLEGGQTLNGFTLQNIVIYYLLVYLINGFTSTYFEARRSYEIRSGKIDMLLTKPFHYYLFLLFYDLGNNIAYFLITVPFVLITFIAIITSVGIELTFPTITQLIPFIFLMVFGYSVEFFIATTTVVLTFWFEGAEGLQHFKWIFITLLSGAMIPLAFMPAWIQSVVQFLPLRYMYDVPIKIIQNQYSLTFSDLSIIFISFFVLMFTTLFLWNRAKYKYTSAGG